MSYSKEAAQKANAPNTIFDGTSHAVAAKKNPKQGYAPGVQVCCLTIGSCGLGGLCRGTWMAAQPGLILFM